MDLLLSGRASSTTAQNTFGRLVRGEAGEKIDEFELSAASNSTPYARAAKCRRGIDSSWINPFGRPRRVRKAGGDRRGAAPRPGDRSLRAVARALGRRIKTRAR